LLLALPPVHTTAKQYNMHSTLAYATQAACTSNVQLCDMPLYCMHICICTATVLKQMRCHCLSWFKCSQKKCKLHNSSRCTSGGKNQLQPDICSDAYHVETLQTASWFVSFRMSKWVSYISVSPGVAYLLNKGDGPAPKYMYIEIPLDAQQIQEVTSR